MLRHGRPRRTEGDFQFDKARVGRCLTVPPVKMHFVINSLTIKLFSEIAHVIKILFFFSQMLSINVFCQLVYIVFTENVSNS